MPEVVLPDRVTVLTCIGCGAMGREERCEGACSEHKLVLVRDADYEALLAAAAAARARAQRLAPVARAFADTDEGLVTLRERAHAMLLEDGPEPQGTDWAAPDTVTGWWCAECGNVDMPQPCIGICVWRPADWVNVTAYERQRALAEPALRAARALRRFVARVAVVTPREGQWERNREALRVQARAALADHVPGAPAPEPPRGGPPQPPTAPVVRVQLWPR